jgi:hypothetical protein
MDTDWSSVYGVALITACDCAALLLITFGQRGWCIAGIGLTAFCALSFLVGPIWTWDAAWLCAVWKWGCGA